MIAGLLNDFIILFVAIDPIATAPLLVPMFKGRSEVEQRRIVFRAIFIASVVLASFGLFGHLLLSTMGISFAAFRIAGGIVLFLVGLQMIFEDPDTMHKQGHAEQGRDLAVFPLAMPYLAGPATTLAVMVATQQEVFDPVLLTAKIAVLALVMAVTAVILLSAAKIQKILGNTGSQVIGRVMGILLAALAAESVIRGVVEAFKL